MVALPFVTAGITVVHAAAQSTSDAGTTAPPSDDTKTAPAATLAAAADDRYAAKLPGRFDWARDKGLVIGVVDAHEITLEELARYLKDRYDPNILMRWGDPNGSLDLNSTAVSQLLWQYADLLLLRSEVRARELPTSGVAAATDAILASGFEEYVQKLEKDRAKLTPAARRTYEQRYRREQGLRAESRALLDLLVPSQYKQTELREWYVGHGDVFYGKVELAHIYFSMRDETTGRLLPPKERRHKRAVAEALMMRLREAPQNFEALAKKNSEDNSTKDRGGRFDSWAKRFDSPLPKPVVRAVWNIKNGEVDGPVESYYGLHIVRRLDQQITKYILFYGGTIERITNMMAEDKREEFMAAMRDRHERRLYL
ncbi:MAG: peptidylprolyl isomerase [Planctomycetes bacterium]|nr:peptidylprolyl isomerase [Planctomycetota bacterium]